MREEEQRLLLYVSLNIKKENNTLIILKLKLIQSETADSSFASYAWLLLIYKALARTKLKRRSILILISCDRSKIITLNGSRTKIKFVKIKFIISISCTDDDE